VVNSGYLYTNRNFGWEKKFLKAGSNYNKLIQALKDTGISDILKEYYILAESLIKEGISIVKISII